MKNIFTPHISTFLLASLLPLNAFAGAPGQDDEGGISLESATEYTRQLEQNRNQQEDKGHSAYQGTHFSLKIMQATMKGSKFGKDDASDVDILAVANSNGGMFSQLRLVPQEMTTTKFMFGAMRQLSSDSQLMLMVPYVEKEMKTRTYNAGGTAIGNFETKASGLGDIALALTTRLPNANAGKWMAGAKISFPTGSIKEGDRVYTPAGSWTHARLPYTMQLGTGTVDFTPSLKGEFDAGDWQVLTGFSVTTRLGRNAEDYSYGDEVNLSLGVARAFDNIKTKLMLDVTSASKITGKDDQITAPVQSAQTGFYGGQRATLTANMQFDRFTAFVSVPVYEDLNGPQMSLDNKFGVSTNFNF